MLSKKIVSLTKKIFKHVKILTIAIDYFLQNKEIVAKNISVFGGQRKGLTERREEKNNVSQLQRASYLEHILRKLVSQFSIRVTPSSVTMTRQIFFCCLGFLRLNGLLHGADVVVCDLLDAQAGKLLGEGFAVPRIKYNCCQNLYTTTTIGT